MWTDWSFTLHRFGWSSFARSDTTAMRSSPSHALDVAVQDPAVPVPGEESDPAAVFRLVVRPSAPGTDAPGPERRGFLRDHGEVAVFKIQAGVVPERGHLRPCRIRRQPPGPLNPAVS